MNHLFPFLWSEAIEVLADYLWTISVNSIDRRWYKSTLYLRTYELQPGIPRQHCSGFKYDFNGSSANDNKLELFQIYRFLNEPQKLFMRDYRKIFVLWIDIHKLRSPKIFYFSGRKKVSRGSEKNWDRRWCSIYLRSQRSHLIQIWQSCWQLNADWAIPVSILNQRYLLKNGSKYIHKYRIRVSMCCRIIIIVVGGYK